MQSVRMSSKWENSFNDDLERLFGFRLTKKQLVRVRLYRLLIEIEYRIYLVRKSVNRLFRRRRKD